MDNDEIGTDVSEILETQAISRVGMGRFEESVSLGQENESLRRITKLEESVGQGQANASLRDYQAKGDQCVASVERPTNRLRTQNWYDELSEQESDDEDGMVGDRPRPAPPRRGVTRARVPVQEFDQWMNQLRDEVQAHGVDREAFHQRVTQFLEEHQRREMRGRMVLEQRVAQFKHELTMP